MLTFLCRALNYLIVSIPWFILHCFVPQMKLPFLSHSPTSLLRISLEFRPHPFHILLLVNSCKHSQIFFSLLGPRTTHDLSSINRGLPLLATYACAVCEPGCSWLERIVPFIPSKTIDMWNKCEGWFIAWWVGPRCYASVKINKEVMKDCQRRINELWESFHMTQKSELNANNPKATSSDEELDAKENKFEYDSTSLMLNPSSKNPLKKKDRHHLPRLLPGCWMSLQQTWCP